MAYERTSSGLLLPQSTSRNVARLGKLSLWANNGLICLSHELPDGKQDFTQLSVDQAIDRCKAIEDDMNDLRRRGIKSDMVKQYADFLSTMHDVIMRAKDQGMPSDPSAGRDRVRRRKTSALIVTPFTGKNNDAQ